MKFYFFIKMQVLKQTDNTVDVNLYVEDKSKCVFKQKKKNIMSFFRHFNFNEKNHYGKKHI